MNIKIYILEENIKQLLFNLYNYVITININEFTTEIWNSVQ